MKVEIKNSNFKPHFIESLFNYLESLREFQKWKFKGLTVELDLTFDFKGDNALIRWTDINEGFNDKLIVNSLNEFNKNFKLINA